MCGASSPKRASIARQAAASLTDSAAIAAAVFSRSLLTPRYVWSRNTLAKQSAAGAKARPCAVNSSLCAVKNGDPANSERFIAQRSWRKPGKVTSPCFDRASGLTRLLHHCNRPAAAQEVDRGREAVMSRADDNCVECVPSRVLSSAD